MLINVNFFYFYLLMNTVEYFQTNIIDNTNNSIKFYLSKINNKYVLHISNPNKDILNINDKNNNFYKQIVDMLFDTNKKSKKGCFNYEHYDSDSIYNYDFEELKNKFLVNEYCIILIDPKFKPLSYLSISDNTLWTLCTNRLYRNKGNMTILINHVINLIKKNKLKKSLDIKNLKIYIKKNNPIKSKLFNYYKSFNFKLHQDLYEYLILKYN
jgi:hypothetical protein